jgi:hypothetical protein
MIRFTVLAVAVAMAAPALAGEPAAPPAPGAGILTLPTSTEPDGRRLVDKTALQPYRGCGPRYDGDAPTGDGRVHGDVTAAVGTQGYRAAGARLCAPIGDAGELQIDLRHVEEAGRRMREHRTP